MRRVSGNAAPIAIVHTGHAGFANADIGIIHINAVNIYELLDYDTADRYYRRKSYLWYEDLSDEDTLLLIKIAYKYISALILSGNMARAIELIGKLSRRCLKGYEHEIQFWVAKERARCYSYQGKLARALD